MIELSRGLPARALEAIADLERRVVEVDGGRLKLEWDSLRRRPAGQVNDVLAWDGPRLDGFLGLYSFDGQNVELVGMVAPDARGRGLGSALLASALAQCRDRRFGRTLLVVPRASRAGRRLAEKYGGVLHHSEHALRLDAPPPAGDSDPRVTLRRATRDDLPDIARLLEAGFGDSFANLEGILDHPGDSTLMIDLGGQPVGTVRLSGSGTEAGVYGFVVDPAVQGRGIGRDVLRRLCRQAFADGAASVRLEVEVDNEHALGLYTSTGFRPVTTEDYYQLRQ